jgi:hypothetical protein
MQSSEKVRRGFGRSACKKTKALCMSKYYDQMEADFNVFGELDDDWERFQKNTSYKAFMVSIKQKR